MFTTPKELARELGYSPKTIRAYLRESHSRPEYEKGDPWEIDEETAAYVRSRFRKRS